MIKMLITIALLALLSLFVNIKQFNSNNELKTKLSNIETELTNAKNEHKNFVLSVNEDLKKIRNKATSRRKLINDIKSEDKHEIYNTSIPDDIIDSLHKRQ